MATVKISIVGFTGKLARRITANLLKSCPNVEVHGICRSPSNIDKDTASNSRIKLFEADFTDITALRQGVAGTSTCICCYLGDSTLMTEGQKLLIDACIAEKVPRYIASDYTFDYRGLQFGEHPAKDPMKHVQKYLEEKNSEIKGVHILIGALTEMMFLPYTFVNAAEGKFWYSGTGDEKLEMTTMDDVAKYTAAIAVDDEVVGFINRKLFSDLLCGFGWIAFVSVLGDSKSTKEIIKIYQQVYGIEPEVKHDGSLEALYEEMTATFEKYPDNPYAWMPLYYRYYMWNGSTLLGELSNDRYPHIVPTSIETFLKSHSRETVGNQYQWVEMRLPEFSVMVVLGPLWQMYFG